MGREKEIGTGTGVGGVGGSKIVILSTCTSTKFPNDKTGKNKSQNNTVNKLLDKGSCKS